MPLKTLGGSGNVCFVDTCFLCDLCRKPDCDIRIQLPQVSKEHCRIDLNENKEVMTHAKHDHANFSDSTLKNIWDNEEFVFE